MPQVNKTRLLRRLPILAVLMTLVGPAILEAQYFGQNKVRYRAFDFKVLKTEHFDIHYYDEFRDAAVQFGQMAERWNARLEKLLDHKLSSRQPVVLYGSHPDFRGTTVIPDYIGETTGGVTEGLRRRLVMPLSSNLADTDHVLGHELVHAFQFDITTRKGPMGGSGLPGALRLPLWFVEGMAEYLSLGPADPHTAMWMRDAVLRDKLPAIGDLNDPRYFPYRWGQAFWAYVAGRYGDEVVGRILKAAGRAGTAEGAIASVLGVSIDTLSSDWHRALTAAYRPVIDSTVAAKDQARPLTAEKRGGALNVSPVVSPDGKYVVYFSEKGVFSIDMFLADAATGAVIHKVTNTAIDPHFDSLQFANSAGAWSKDSSRFAFGGINRGRPMISIFDVAGRRVTRRIPLNDLTDILNVTWSPDGQAIAFSAMAEGYTDLYVVDLKDGKVRQLTRDPFADLAPSWSPDGSRIAFSTDRFTSDLGSLSFGELRLGLITPDGKSVEPVPAFATGKHVGPQWSGDGSALYFLSDHSGVSNVYSVRLSDGTFRQITNLQTGVSGISKLSPAFSVAQNSDRLVFSAFEEGDYRLYAMEGFSALAGKPVSPAASEAVAGLLPPEERSSNAVRELLRAPRVGLLTSSGFQTTKYRPSLSLDYIAPPNVTLGTGNFGSFIGGGTALYWSDLLGQHNLMTAFQTSTTTEGGRFWNSLSGIAAYQNQKSRWNWGLVGGQVPYLTGGYNQFLTFVDGQPVVVDQTIRAWEISREVSGVLSRPFSRAQRVEFSTGYQNISYDAQADVQLYSAITGQLLGQQRVNIPTAPALHMGVAKTALVFDTSIFGGTSPIAGQSYRLEFGTSAGSLKYTSVLADYRRYLRLARPITLAGRLMHYGRYGWDAENSRMQDIFLGYPSLIRGYEADSFSIGECGPALFQTGACPVFDRLFGSRMAVANAELRVPLLGFLGVVPSRGLPPVEGALFYDAGIAWTSGELARRMDRPRKPVSSYGASLRFNVFGYAIGQLSYVKAIDRPLKPWHWEFSFSPGF
ncbi:MAG: basic secretory protein-like protein [Bryobacteraceae bacterium]